MVNTMIKVVFSSSSDSLSPVKKMRIVAWLVAILQYLWVYVWYTVCTYVYHQ